MPEPDGQQHARAERQGSARGDRRHRRRRASKPNAKSSNHAAWPPISNAVQGTIPPAEPSPSCAFFAKPLRDLAPRAVHAAVRRGR